MGIIFIIISNYFAVLAPQVTGFVVDKVSSRLKSSGDAMEATPEGNKLLDPMVRWFSEKVDLYTIPFSRMILYTGAILLVLALLRGFFMFLMRQTIIVMSRHIEFDQKNDIYKKYQSLSLRFYRQHNTGDLMARISEDVGRVRMYKIGRAHV